MYIKINKHKISFYCHWIDLLLESHNTCINWRISAEYWYINLFKYKYYSVWFALHMKKIMVLELEVYIFCFVQYLYAFFLLYIYNNNKVYLYKAFILFHPSQMTYYYT